MKLEDLSNALKDTASYLDSCMEWADAISGQDAFKEYIKSEKQKNDFLFCQEEELEKAFHAGFIIALRQQKSGKFKEL